MAIAPGPKGHNRRNFSEPQRSQNDFAMNIMSIGILTTCIIDATTIAAIIVNSQ